jgi:FKBP-type peptidyl-prolyl cis-trans isomerase FklB
MKVNLLIVLLSLSALVSCSKYSGKSAAGSGSTDLAGQIDSVSYSFGVDIANSIVSLKVEELNMAALVQGFETVLKNDTAHLKIKMTATRQIIMAYIQNIQNKKNEKNKKEGVAFLEANKKKPGVKVTASGLQYIVIKAGNGPLPGDSSTVKVHYTGTLINDSVFDSSIKRGQPIEIPVSGVVRGWQEALKMMPVGSKWKIFIPQELAYGESGARGSIIEPFMPIIFEMELLEIVPPKPPVNPADMTNQQNAPK